jgi:hypothetical protein
MHCTALRIAVCNGRVHRVCKRGELRGDAAVRIEESNADREPSTARIRVFAADRRRPILSL